MLDLTKHCKYCNTHQPSDGFHGLKCKKCVAIYKNQYYEENKKEILENRKQYREEHKEDLSEYDKQYREVHKEEILIREKKYREDHKEEILEQKKQYYEENKEERKIYNTQYRKEHKEELSQYRVDHKEETAFYNKEYRKKNKEEISEYQKDYDQKHKTQRNSKLKERRENDPAFKLADTVSSAIYSALTKEGGSKNGSSCWEHITWTIEEFWEDFEKKFSLPENLTPDGKVWMTRLNQGVYSKKIWKDNDPSTWTWQLDHIIPHSEFSYTSMDSDLFRECWKLSNLRPLSSKQNVLDGANKTRHKREDK